MKMSRTDIMTAAMNAGLDYEDAEDIANALLPECQTVPDFRVRKMIRLYGGNA